MKFDLSHFRKVKDEDGAAVLQHPDGHHIVIAKHVLSPKMQKQLDALPHFVDGGEAQANTLQDSPDQIAQDAAQVPPQRGLLAQLGDIPDVMKTVFTPNGIENRQASISSDIERGASGQGANTAPGNYPVGGGGQNQAPLPMLPNTKGMESAYNQQEAGNRAAANAESIRGVEEGLAGETAEQNLMDIQKGAQAQLGQLNDESNRLTQDVMNGHINPNHYQESMDTGQKVSTAIGLLLGGLSSGLTGQGNPALDFLNKQIDRDIESQKADMGKRATLLEANLRKYGNLVQATSMTRAQEIGIMQARIAQAAANQRGPEAQARAQAINGQLEIPKQQMLYEQGMKSEIMNRMRQPNGGGVDPAVAVNWLIPKEEQKEANNQLQLAENHQTQSQVINDAFNQADRENTVANRAMHLGGGGGSKYRFQLAVMPYLKDAEGRVNESEMQLIQDNTPSPGDMPDRVATKRAAINNFLEEKASAPLLRGHGIVVPKKTGWNPK